MNDFHVTNNAPSTHDAAKQLKRHVARQDLYGITGAGTLLETRPASIAATTGCTGLGLGLLLEQSPGPGIALLGLSAGTALALHLGQLQIWPPKRDTAIGTALRAGSAAHRIPCPRSNC